MQYRLWQHELFPQGLHQFTLPSQLAVWFMPTTQARYHAALTVHYGALDLCFERDGQRRELPPGVAHFLEHQMFTTEGGDAFEEFARLGASANAFTSYEQTTYLYSTTENFYPALELLLRLVRSPGFSAATVEKERGIIEQELRMYEDMPFFRVNRNLREALYAHHQARFDVGGTVESIGEITVDHLWEAFNTFYQPAHMLLFLTGDLSAAAVGDWLSQHAGGGSTATAVRRLTHAEPPGVVRERVEAVIPVSVPILQLGFKDTDFPGAEQSSLRRELLTSVVHHALFGRTSPLYQELYQEGLAGQLNADYESGHHYGLSIITAETDRVETTLEKVRAAISVARAQGLTEATVRRGVLRMQGNLVAMFNHPESVGQFIVSQLLRGLGPLALMELLPAITVDEVNERLSEHLDSQHSAVSIVTAPPSTG